MNDLLQRLSASGEKIGVECGRVENGNWWELFLPTGQFDRSFPSRCEYLYSAIVRDGADEVELAPATMLLLKALEAKGWKWQSNYFSDDENYKVNAYRDLSDLRKGLHKAYATTYFEAVLKATVEVVEGL